jgi:hypothetical protein
MGKFRALRTVTKVADTVSKVMDAARAHLLKTIQAYALGFDSVWHLRAMDVSMYIFLVLLMVVFTLRKPLNKYAYIHIAIGVVLVLHIKSIYSLVLKSLSYKMILDDNKSPVISGIYVAVLLLLIWFAMLKSPSQQLIQLLLYLFVAALITSIYVNINDFKLIGKLGELLKIEKFDEILQNGISSMLKTGVEKHGGWDQIMGILDVNKKLRLTKSVVMNAVCIVAILYIKLNNINVFKKWEN